MTVSQEFNYLVCQTDRNDSEALFSLLQSTMAMIDKSMVEPHRCRQGKPYSQHAKMVEDNHDIGNLIIEALKIVNDGLESQFFEAGIGANQQTVSGA